MFKKNSKNTIFIGGLPGSTTQESLKTYFERFGEISKISTVQNNKKNNLSKGYALITYKLDVSYEQALKVPEHYLFKRVISCQPYLQGAQLSQYLEDLNSRRLFVKYIPKNINNKQFEKIFRKHGDVDFGYVVKDPKTSVSRGFGYITFKTQELAREVEKMRFVKIKNNRKLKIFPYKRRGAEEDQKKKKSVTATAKVTQNQVNQKRPLTPLVKKTTQQQDSKRTSLVISENKLALIANKGSSKNSNSADHSLNDYSIKPTSSQWFVNLGAKNQARADYSIYSHSLSNLEFNRAQKAYRMNKLEYCRKLAEEQAEEDLPDFLKMPFILPALK